MMKKIKRFIAVICCIAIVAAGFSAENLSEIIAWAQGSGSEAEISITAVEGNIGASAEERFLNMTYSGIPSDYSRGMDFLDAAFVNEYITFGGGMTYEDLMKGKVTFYLATSDILQFNWAQRTEPFTAGWFFTIQKGARLPYIDKAEGTKYVILDKEYTFTFDGSSDAGIYNHVSIAGYQTTTYSMNPNPEAPIANGSSGESNFNLTSDGIVNWKMIYQSIVEDASYADYIEISGVAYTDLAGKGVKLRYILAEDGSTKVLQMENWGTLRNELTVGDQIIFRKGLPIYYTDSDGVSWKATLDSDYVYECMYAKNGEHDQIFGGIKCDASYKGYDLTTYNEIGTFSQTAEVVEQCINVGFAEGHNVDKAAGISENLLTEKQAENYIELPNKDFSDATFRFIPSASTLQLAFGPKSVAALEVGDQIILKEGLSVIYQGSGTYGLESATLRDSYVFEVTAKTDDTLTFSCGLYGTFGLTSIFYWYGEGGYANVPYAEGSLSDSATFESSIDDSIMEKYFEVSGVVCSKRLLNHTIWKSLRTHNFTYRRKETKL